jgi:hypothetical protein
MPSARSLLVLDRFAPEGPRLRAHFDERFADPRSARADRFVWDFWHVPGQYTLLRTPAWRFFPKRLYASFHRRLVLWGRRTLGCHDISPPWLSCYVEGCRQEWHGDLPHGPWAFVYSLTSEPRAFRGGETLLLRDEVLDYWRDFRSERSLEEAGIVEEVAPRPNRLVVFDPRLPHAVRRVEGTLDPREGRLVIHGWFVRPRPFIEGPLPPAALSRAIAHVSERAVLPALEHGLPLAGIVSFAFRVGAAGSVSGLRVLSDTTRVPPEEDSARRQFLRGIAATLRAHRFPRAKSASRVTLPLVFER